MTPSITVVSISVRACLQTRGWQSIGRLRHFHRIAARYEKKAKDSPVVRRIGSIRPLVIVCKHALVLESVSGFRSWGSGRTCRGGRNCGRHWCQRLGRTRSKGRSRDWRQRRRIPQPSPVRFHCGNGRYLLLASGHQCDHGECQHVNSGVFQMQERTIHFCSLHRLVQGAYRHHVQW